MSCRLLSQHEHPMYPDNVLDPARKESNLPIFAKGSVGDSTRLLAAFWKRHFRAVFNAYSRHLGCRGGEGVGPGIMMATCIQNFSPLSAFIWLSVADSTSVEWQSGVGPKLTRKLIISSVGQEISSVACVQLESPRRFHRVSTSDESNTIGARTDYILSNSWAGDFKSRTERHQKGPIANIHLKLGTQHQYHQRAAPRMRLPLELSDEAKDKRAVWPRARLPRHRERRFLCF